MYIKGQKLLYYGVFPSPTHTVCMKPTHVHLCIYMCRCLLHILLVRSSWSVSTCSFLCSCVQGSIGILDAAEKRYRTVMRSHTDSIVCMGLSPKGGHLVTGSADCTVRIWDMETLGQVGGAWEGQVELHVHASCCVVCAPWVSWLLLQRIQSWDGSQTTAVEWQPNFSLCHFCIAWRRLSKS